MTTVGCIAQADSSGALARAVDIGADRRASRTVNGGSVI